MDRTQSVSDEHKKDLREMAQLKLDEVHDKQ